MTIITIKILKVSGLDIVGCYVGLPVGKVLRDTNANPNYIPPDKLATLTKLVKAGDEHAKILRQVVAWFEITAPRYWLQQLETYKIGVQGYSASIMHVTPRDISSNVNDAVDQRMIDLYQVIASEIETSDLSSSAKIRALKSNLPEGFMQTRLKMFSYQTLRRIWRQRQTHRLPEWREFLKSILALPYAEELIVG